MMNLVLPLCTASASKVLACLHLAFIVFMKMLPLVLYHPLSSRL